MLAFAAPRADKFPTVTAVLAGVRVLAVDNREVNRLILREMLTSRGAEVHEAADGPSALRMLMEAGGRRSPIPVADTPLPRAWYRRIHRGRAMKASGCSGLSVTLLTSDDLRVEIPKAARDGLDAQIIKPVRRAESFESIADAMARAEKRGRQIENPVASPQHDETAANPLAKADKASLVPSGVNSRPVRIPLTDDSPDNRLLIRAYLKDPIYHLDDVENGAIAVEEVKVQRYDVVPMDIQMPVMDGFTATRLIREWESDSSMRYTPIVTLTASALEDDVRRTLEAGADRQLSKPGRKKMLIATIESLDPAMGVAVQPVPQLTVVRG